jgi:peptidoglycan/LPS O-acetylase OafA/YrhL
VLGHLSFSLYLWHMSVVVSIHRQFWAIPSFPISNTKIEILEITAVLGLSFVIAYISFWTIEKYQLFPK